MAIKLKTAQNAISFLSGGVYTWELLRRKVGLRRLAADATDLDVLIYQSRIRASGFRFQYSGRLRRNCCQRSAELTKKKREECYFFLSVIFSDSNSQRGYSRSPLAGIHFITP